VQMDRHSSEHGNSSDDHGEEADYSSSLHKKEMLEREYDDDNEDDGAFSENGSDGPPSLPNPWHLLLVMTNLTIKIAKFFCENPQNSSNQTGPRNQGSVSLITLKVNCCMLRNPVMHGPGQ
jgi:hypothetical protein